MDASSSLFTPASSHTKVRSETPYSGFRRIIKKETWTKTCCLKCSSIALIVVGIVTVVLGIVVHFALPPMLDHIVIKTIVVDSPSHAEYKAFVSNAYADAPVKYHRVYIYNVTNPREVLHNGIKPVFEEIGPFTFREYYNHLNVTFNDDGSEVTFSEAVTNTFQPEMSGKNLSLATPLTVFNLPYIKVMYKTGSESNLLQIASSQVIPTVLDEFRDKLIEGIQGGAFVEAATKLIGVLKLFNGGEQGVLWKMGGCATQPSTLNDTDVLAPTNSSIIDLPPYNGTVENVTESKCVLTVPWGLTSLATLLNTSIPLSDAIDVPTMKSLFNASDTLSFMNKELNQGVYLWLDSAKPRPWYDDPNYYNIVDENRSVGSEDVSNVEKYLPPKPDSLSQNLTRHFNLTATQFEMLQQWVIRASQSSILEEKVLSKLNGMFTPAELKVVTYQDLVFRQWLASDVLLTLKGGDFPSVQVGAEPEFGRFLKRIKWIDVQTHIRPETSPLVLDTTLPVPIKFRKRRGSVDLEDLNWSLDTVRCIEKFYRSNVTFIQSYFFNFEKHRPGKREDFLNEVGDDKPVLSPLGSCFSRNTSTSPEDQAEEQYLGVTLLRMYMNYTAKNVVRTRLSSFIDGPNDIGPLRHGLITTKTAAELFFGMQEPILKTVLKKDDPRHWRFSILPRDGEVEVESHGQLDEAYFTEREASHLPLQTSSGDAVTYSDRCRSTSDFANDYFSCRQIVSIVNGTRYKRYIRAPSTVKTGKSNISEIGTFVKVQGYSVLKNMYWRDLDVRSFGDGLSFPPLNAIENRENVTIFVPTITAPLTFVKNNEVDIEGVKAIRFKLPDSQFSTSRPDADVFFPKVILNETVSELNATTSIVNTTDANETTFLKVNGYSGSEVTGMLNLTEAMNIEIFVTRPHYTSVSGMESFVGITQTASDENDNMAIEEQESYLDIEPVTGKTLRAKVRMSIVAGIATTRFDEFYPKLYKTPYVPIMSRELHGEATEAQRRKITKKIYPAQWLAASGWWIAFALGWVMILVGSFLFVWWKKEKEQRTIWELFEGKYI